MYQMSVYVLRIYEMSVYYKIPSISSDTHTHSSNKLSDTKLSKMISHNNLK